MAVKHSEPVIVEGKWASTRPTVATSERLALAQGQTMSREAWIASGLLILFGTLLVCGAIYLSES
jgi:hypothetical protein